jgi:hypothetical protein
MIKTGSAWAGSFVTLDATGAVTAATGTPTGTLYVDGTANGASVTITGSNPYKWAVTLPSLTAGQRVDMYITGTIDSVSTAGFVASEQADTSILSDGVVVNSGTVTTLTNLPAVTTDWLTAAGVKADAVTKIQNGLALEATLTAIKGAGWSTETLAAIDVLIDAIKAKTDLIPATPAVADEYDAALAAIQADLDNPDQYKADVSGLATTAHVQEVENKIDAIDVTVNTIPTNPLLDTAYTAPDNAGIAAILEDTGTTIPATLAGLATSTEVGAIALLDETVIGSYTVQDILKILAAKMVGKATGGSTATITYRGVDDTSDVIVETVDSNGNRSAVTLTV